ncbi:MAG: hypothetical protein AB8B91_14835 [Rubripirellula sp.]
MNDDLYYKHSGRVGFAAPLILVVGIPLIILLSAIYSYIVVYCPVVGYVNVVFLYGYWIASGTVLGGLAKTGKCRNPMLLFVLGGVVGLVGLYFAWVFFVKALFPDASVLALTMSPMNLWEIAVRINADGWWGPSGVFQWAIVGAEAVAMVGGLAWLAYASVDREVFCEDCGSWCEPFETIQLEVTEELLATPQTGWNHLELLGLEPAEPTDYPRLDAETLQCTGCELTQAIRFKMMTQVMDDGQPKEQAEDIPGILVQKKRG